MISRWRPACIAAALVTGAAATVTGTGAASAAVTGVPVFFATAFSTEGCSLLDLDDVAGDSRGGVIATGTNVFATGDDSTARTDLELDGLASTGQLHDAMLTDLRSGKAYVLADAAGEMHDDGGTVTRLLELDANGVTTTAEVVLETPIDMDYGYDDENDEDVYAGIFSGYGAAILYDGESSTATVIEPATGDVHELGEVPYLPAYGNENWAIWGGAERYADGSFGIVYADQVDGSGDGLLRRMVLPTGDTTTLQTFSLDSGADPDLAFSPSNSRWYLKNEYDSQFGLADEALVSCPASYVIGASDVPEPIRSTISVTAVEATAVEGGEPGQLSFTRTGGSINPELPVRYTISGTAGTADVPALTGEIVFPEDVLQVDVPVAAVADGIADSGEVLTVGLTSTAAYTPHVLFPEASVTLEDPPAACEPASTSSYGDLGGNVHASAIECSTQVSLLRGGPAGLPSDFFGPALSTTRGQIATITARMLAAAGVELPARPANAYGDDDGHTHELSINQLAALSIAPGADGDSFFPDAAVQRGEMSAFLNAAHSAITGAALTSDTDAFFDDNGTEHEDDINGLASVGIVKGDSRGRVFPSADIRRDQLASLLARHVEHLAATGHPLG